MSRVGDLDGLHLYGWMRNILHLSGGELITFAIVYRSSQSKTGIYVGGIPYVADFIGCTKETARKYLHSLEERGLIIGKDIDINGVHYRNYQIVDSQIPKKFGYIPKNFGGGDTQKISQGIPKKFGLEEYNNKNNTLTNAKDIDAIYNLYPSTCPIKGRSTSKCAKNREQIANLLRTKTPEQIKATIEWYVNDCKQSNTYLKNFTTFLNQFPEEIPTTTTKQHKSIKWNDIA